MSPTIEQFLSQIINFGAKLGASILVLIVGIIVAKLIAKAIRKLLVAIHIDKLGEKLNDISIVNKANVDFKISSVVSKIVYYFAVLIFLVVAAHMLNMKAITDLL